MTPQERQLVDDLFDRLAKLETAPRDPDAERAIMDGLKRAPNAVYALVQTALVQDEALKRADAKIRELSGEAEPQPQGGFLDTHAQCADGHLTHLGADRERRRRRYGRRSRPALEPGRHVSRRRLSGRPGGLPAPATRPRPASAAAARSSAPPRPRPPA